MSSDVATQSTDEPTWHFRVRPIKAFRAMIDIRQNPGDLSATARFFFYVGGHDDGSTYRRIVACENGKRVLENRVPLPAALIDLASLKQYEPGSVGRIHADFLEREALDPAQIDQDTRRAHSAFEVSAEHEFIRVRTRSLHDLIHTMTGYGVDMLGEGGAVAFTFGNIRNRGYLMLTLTNLLGILLAGNFRAIPFMFKAYRCGRRAKFLWAEDWDEHLSQPLEQVRARLDITPLAPYDVIPFDR
jgi:ubiquinone biosynthesis protein COQ4